MQTQETRNEIANDFRQLGTLLLKNNVCSDSGPLSRAASNVQSRDFLSGSKWGYKLEGLTFHLDKPKGVLPGDLNDFQIELSVRATTETSCKPDDPFTELEINIEKSGKKALCGTILKAAWHLDRHPYGEAKSVHPLYHFQLGGEKIKELEGNLGLTFITTAPRIMHPPMDGIISIDFILANYWYEKWVELKEDPYYLDLVKRAYERYWAPFFRRLSNHFGDISLENNNNANLLCPFFPKI